MNINYSKNMIKLLHNRGLYDPLDIESFLFPSLNILEKSNKLINMDNATELIMSHIIKKNKILVYGDYDCDGIGAAAIIYLALKKKNVKVDVFLPQREEDGYGLNIDTLKQVLPKYKPNLLITVDCGIQSNKEVNYLKSLNIDVIITDHHEPGKTIPDCIVVNPKIQNKIEDELSGAGVAFMLIKSLFGFEYAKEYLDICAVSTVADLVPLVGDNRIIVKEGLKLINNGYTRPGIQALIKIISQNKPQPINTNDISFKIAPRLNATGRITSAIKSFRLIVSDSYPEIQSLAKELDDENKIRQNLCDKIATEVKEKLLYYDIANNPMIILYDPHWESGIIGIVASKIVDMFDRPTILLTKGTNGLIKGSGRSVKGVDILDILINNKKHLLTFGGHTMAAGLQLKEDSLECFIKDCNEYLRKKYSFDVFTPRIPHELEIKTEDISLSFAQELKLLEPFGTGNPQPVFKSVVKDFKMERIKNYQHIKRVVSEQIEFVAFNKIIYQEMLESDLAKNIYYTIDKKQYKQKYYASCIIKNIELIDFKVHHKQLLYNYYARFLPCDNKYLSERKDTKPNAMFGEIILVWSKEHFNTMVKKYPNYKKAYKQLTSLNPINTIILSPDIDVNLDYYSRLVVVDSFDMIININKSHYEALNILLEYLELYEDLSMKTPVSKGDVEQSYLYIQAYSNKKEYIDIRELFNHLKGKGFGLSSHVFEICIIILQEINAILWQDNTVYVNEKSHSLEASKVYKLINKI